MAQQKAIGPSFASDVAAAGVAGVPFSWSPDGTITFTGATPAQVAAVQAVYAAHDPAKPDIDTVLAQKIAAGIAITSTGTPALTATYGLDPTTLEQVGSVARDAGAGLGLPGNVATFNYPDITGANHAFTATAIQNLYKAMRDMMLVLDTQYGIAAAGGTPIWPKQSATIA